MSCMQYPEYLHNMIIKHNYHFSGTEVCFYAIVLYKSNKVRVKSGQEYSSFTYVLQNYYN